MIHWKAFVIALALGATHSACQDVPQDKSTKACSFSEAYLKDGWTIPGLDGSVPQFRQAWKDNPGFFITQLKPSRAESSISPDVFCPYDHPGRLEVLNQPIRVMILASWDYKGRVFGYFVAYARQVVENGIRSELGAASVVQFFDMDGSGRFTVMRFPNVKNPVKPAIIPAWVRESTDAAPTN